MVYQPVIPLTGYGGWKFLESTFDKQLEGFTDSARVKNDRQYFQDKMSSPIAMEDFLSDKRLLRISLTAFDLGGEEWKVGFIRHVMEEKADPDSNFLTRLNNQAYTNFANTFAITDGNISLSADTIATLSDDFELASFRSAVGDVDNNMKLSLNYKAKIGDLVREESSDSANLYRILGDVPVSHDGFHRERPGIAFIRVRGADPAKQCRRLRINREPEFVPEYRFTLGLGCGLGRLSVQQFLKVLEGLRDLRPVRLRNESVQLRIEFDRPVAGRIMPPFIQVRAQHGRNFLVERNRSSIVPDGRVLVRFCGIR